MDETTALTPRKSSSRILELDALRALAAINLMLFHFTHVYTMKYGFTSDLGFQFPFGKYGVQLFFMLSGLVNALTLLKKRQTGEFLTGRFCRIVPAFLLVIVLNILLVQIPPISDHIQLTAGQVVANLTTMPNLFGYECMEPVTWTLQNEALFYVILIAFFASGALERPLIPLMWYMALCVAGSMYVAWIDETSFGASHFNTAKWLESALLLKYMPLFTIGILIHQVYSKSGDAKYNWIGVAIAGFVFHLIDERDHNPVVTVLLVGLLTASVYGKLPILRIKPLMFMSGISYSLYLMHNNLGSVFIYYANHAGVPPKVCFVLVIGLTIAFSALATHLIERPASRQFRKLWDSAFSRWRSIKGASAIAFKDSSRIR